MNNAAKTSLRLIAPALALAAGLAIGAVAGAAVAQPLTELGVQRTDVVRAPVTKRGGAPERGVPTAFGLTDQRFDVARAPVTRRGGAPTPAAGGAWTGLAAGY